MAMNPEQQLNYDRMEVTIRPIVNGWIVKSGPLWYAYQDHSEMLKKVSDFTSAGRKILLEKMGRDEKAKNEKA